MTTTTHSHKAWTDEGGHVTSVYVSGFVVEGLSTHQSHPCRMITQRTQQITRGRYRPEIDGLRAFAVVSVIINHFNQDILPGGYLGVDIFFVISGYVITSSLSGRQSKRFMEFISGFFERRVKRLVPALSAFVSITSIVVCLFNPSPGLSLLTGVTSLFGLSNLYLLKQSTDYFAQSSELNVFMHTWSLGVEEQFYMLFPFLIWFSGFGRQTKNGARNLFLFVGVLAIASLISYLYLYHTNQPASYFLMPSRFWELASGCLIFIGFVKRASIEQLLEKVPPLVLLGLIVGLMYLPISFAAEATISVVVLSSILIASLKNETVAFKLFTNPGVIYIGLISYSLYLWHWGVLSISRWTIGVHWWSVPIQVALMLGLAIASHRWIETPLRNGNWFGKRWKNLLIGGAILVSLSGGIAALGKSLKGLLYVGDINSFISKPLDYKGKFTGRVAKYCHTSSNAEYDSLGGSTSVSRQFKNMCLSSKTNKPLIAFSGDSHSLAIFPVSEVIASNLGYDVFSHSRDGCAYPPQGETIAKNCYEVQSSITEAIIDEISSRRSGSIIVATSYLSSHFGYDGSHRKGFKKHSDGSKNSVDMNLEDFITSSKKLARRLEEMNASLVLIAPFPEHHGFTSDAFAPQWFRPSRVASQKSSRSSLELKYKHIVESLRKLAMHSSNIYIFNPFDDLCDKMYCYSIKDSNVLYVDDNHLSEAGAMAISGSLSHLIERINSVTDSHTR